MTTTDQPTQPLDLAAIRLDLEEVDQRWTDPEENMYGLLSAAGKLVEHNRTLLSEVDRLRVEVARMADVVDTARAWRHGVLTSGEECSTYALACAVDALDERSGR